MSIAERFRALAALAAAALLVCACATNPMKALREAIDGAGPKSLGPPKPPAAHPLEKKQPPTAEELLKKGDEARDTGQRSTAVWNYLRANQLDPTDPTPRERIAFVHLEEDPERAAAIFESLAREHPDYARAHAGLGLAKLRLGDPAGAKDALEKALALDPNNARSRTALGVVYDQLGNHAEAQEHYRAATELAPEDPDALNNLGFSLILSGDYQGAVDALQQAIRLEPNDPALYNNLGLALGRLGRYDAALDAFRKGGDEQAAQNNLGYVYALGGDAGAAFRHFEKALRAPGNERLKVVENIRSTGAPEPQPGSADKSQEPQKSAE